MYTWHIHIKGIVQGVGFRPFVYQLASTSGINGWVNNDMDGVHIEFSCGEDQADRFYKKILHQAPPLSEIIYSSLARKEDLIAFDTFHIIHSETQGSPNSYITPDFVICSKCKAEIEDKNNRRFGYAFTTCTDCGPRFSIIDKVPYDRIHTAMHSFKMCASCQKEYDNPLDRRYYSQTNSCPECGIQMKLFSVDQTLIEEDQSLIIETICDLLSQGKILAIKGIGGYLLIADATNDAVVDRLRERKNRPQKPFALMYADMEAIKKDLDTSTKEQAALLDKSAPIVLLSCKKGLKINISNKVAPNLKTLGVMLPYTPLYHLIMAHWSKPIIATSANISGSPIVFKDKNAFEQLASIADYVLTNNRPINVTQDDSVIRFSKQFQQKIILRRSRGLAPNLLQKDLNFEGVECLATGAHMKSSFTFIHNDLVFVSPFLGKLDGYYSQQNFDYTLQYFRNIINAQPNLILADKHPLYYTNQKAIEIAEEENIPIQFVQHHKAHFAAILGEHNLLHSEEKILGIIWDGTGLGDDDQIWGGEFFVYENNHIERVSHIEYFPVILGDKMSVEPRICALSFFGIPIDSPEIIGGKFSERELQLYTKFRQQAKSLKTSSIGRIFDAIASILGLVDKSSYEAEAAIRLEQLAQESIEENGISDRQFYSINKTETKEVSFQAMKIELLEDLKNEIPIGKIAYKFHETLVQIIKIQAKENKTNKLAFSGGVFQNSVLVDLISARLNNEFELYFHQQLSPGDENISFGQAVYHLIRQQKTLNESAYIK